MKFNLRCNEIVRKLEKLRTRNLLETDNSCITIKDNSDSCRRKVEFRFKTISVESNFYDTSTSSEEVIVEFCYEDDFITWLSFCIDGEPCSTIIHFSDATGEVKSVRNFNEKIDTKFILDVLKNVEGYISTVEQSLNEKLKKEEEQEEREKKLLQEILAIK